MTVEQEAFRNSATVGVESVLNQLPQFVPAGSQFEGGGIQASTTSSPGAATLNLRGLGTNRNLVLLDGRRPQPGNASLTVDVNTIPSAAIASVEVITGGASAVYGPDAMAGVVNFILRDNFEGVELDFHTGQTAEGDGTESRFSALFGANSADGRGNVMIGIDYTDRDAVYTLDRDWYIDGWNDPAELGGGFLNAWTYAGNETAIEGGRNLPSQAAVNTLFARYGVAADVVKPDSNLIFNSDGTIFTDIGGYGYNGPLNCWEGCGTFTGIKQDPLTGNLNQIFTDGFVSFPMERHSVFLKGSYDVADRISVFAQAQFTDSSVITRGGTPPAITVWQAPIPRDGRPLPDDLNVLLDSRTTVDGEWSLYDVMAYNGPIEPVNDTNVRQFMIGLEGEVGDGDTTWELYYSRGDTTIIKNNKRMPSLQRYQAMVAAPNFGQGGITAARGYSIQCDSGLPIFNDFVPDASCLDGIEGGFIDNSNLTQNIIEGNIQGRVADIYAGEIRYAAGATYRENEADFRPFNAAGSIIENPIGVFASNSTGGKIDVTEYYGELLVPLAQEFELELGYRYSDFSTAGGHDTYKGLFTWQGTDTITVRGGFQQATRAPNVAELFTSPTQQVVFFPTQDPCSSTTLATWGNVPTNPDRLQVQDLCRQMIGNNMTDFDTQTYSQFGIDGPDGWHRRIPPFFPLAIELRAGNPNVLPETGKTYTMGAVFNGTIVDSLTLTVDFYRIEIEDTIAPTSVVTIYDNCFNRYGTNPTYDINDRFCQLIRRNPVTGDRQQVDAFFNNLGILETQGLDVQVNWRKDLGPGAFAIDSTLNFLDYYRYQDAPGQAINEGGGTLARGGLFDLSGYTRFSYAAGNYSFGLSWRYLSSVEDQDFAMNGPATIYAGTGSYSEFGLTGRYNFDRYAVRFGVDNLFDTDPQNIGAVDLRPGRDNNATATDAGYYDLLGRSYYIGLEMSFE